VERTLKPRKWFVLLGLITGIAIGGVLYWNAKTVYQSTATVTILPSSGPYLMNSTSEILRDYEARLLPDILITQKDIISTALKNHESVQNLPSLKNFNDNEKVEYITYFTMSLQSLGRGAQRWWRANWKHAPRGVIFQLAILSIRSREVALKQPFFKEPTTIGSGLRDSR